MCRRGNSPAPCRALTAGQRMCLLAAVPWLAYGGSASTFGHASVAEQNAVFANAMATPRGRNNWSPYDGC